MPQFPDYYPPSPAELPEGLTEMPLRYRRQINAVAFALTLFFLVYVGLLLTLLLVALILIRTLNPCAMVLAIAPLAGIGFFVKCLFVKKPWGKGYEIEIFPDEHPRLFNFIECVCEETNAPMPHRVLVNCEVNASAGSAISILSLFKEPERELILGLGLINVLNLTEFKALLAHEFGHLTQFGTGNYVFVGKQVVYAIVSQYTFMEWIFILWIKLHLKLSHEMEYHADLTAVSVAGSDAVPQLLYKSLWGDLCMQQTIADLDRARDHDLYSTDIFVHHLMSGKHLRKRRKDPTFGQPPVLPANRRETVQMFRPDEDEQATMWSSHPSNFDRELNAKARYIRSDFDEESAWSLFDNPAELRRTLSVKFYKQCFGVKKDRIDWSGPRAVQAFLEDEFAETNFDYTRYGLLYNTRNLQIFSVPELTAVSAQMRNPPADLVRSHQTMYSPMVKRFAKMHIRHTEEFQLLNAIANRWFRPDDGRFKMRGKKFPIRAAKKLRKQVSRELEADSSWLRLLDTCVFVTYYELALWLDPKKADELARRYRFHFLLQEMWVRMQDQMGPMEFMFDILRGQQDTVLDNWLFYLMIDIFRKAHDAVREVLRHAEELTFPALANMPKGETVRPYLMKGRLPDKPTEYDVRMSPKWMKKFADKFYEVHKRLDRLHFKSLGAILALQEQLGAEAEQKWR